MDTVKNKKIVAGMKTTRAPVSKVKKMGIRYGVVSRGNALYITERKGTETEKIACLASKQAMERIVCEMNCPIEIELGGLSQVQLGSVLKAVDLIDCGQKKITLQPAQKNGRSLLIAKRR